MADYQKQRQVRVRAEREQALRDGTAETFADIVRQQPLRVLLTLVAIVFLLGLVALRSEEHTSELQSLMRISYAVFCLKKHNITSLTTAGKKVETNRYTPTSYTHIHNQIFHYQKKHIKYY